MGTAAKPTRENRTITVDFQNEATYFQLLGDGKAFVSSTSESRAAPRPLALEVQRVPCLLPTQSKSRGILARDLRNEHRASALPGPVTCVRLCRSCVCDVHLPKGGSVSGIGPTGLSPRRRAWSRRRRGVP